jgi:UDP-N-acetylmuramate--alanine ligase
MSNFENNRSDSHADRRHGAPGTAHLIGIGGAGMQALAAVLLGRGWQVTGSDLRPESAVELAACGARIFAGHSANHLPADATLAIYSDAVPPSNVERQEAHARKIPLRSYPEMLGELGRGRPTLAVAGTHGKSTVTAMTAAALVAGGLDPLVVCGASPVPNGRTTSDSACSTFRFGGRAGDGPLVVEACEYRANFLRIQPQTAVLLNIEPDHFDYFHSLAELHAAFRAFVERVPGAKDIHGDGLVLYNRACRASRRIVRDMNCRTQSFGLSRRADWSARGLQTRRGGHRFQLVHRGRSLAELALPIPGLHNVLNAIAATAAAVEAGVDPQTATTAIAAFPGLRRRLELIGTFGGVTLLDDYAHHPTAVRAALTTVRRMYPGRRLWCVFQPHQASRTAALLDELAASLHNADRLVVAEIYRAREPSPRPGEVTAADLSAAVRNTTVRQATVRQTTGRQTADSEDCDVCDEHDFHGIQTRLQNELRDGDVLITIGAGDIGKISEFLVQRLRSHCARS